MKISMLGGAGFLGRKVVARLARQGRLGDQPITSLTLFDLTVPAKPDAAFPTTAIAGDLVELPPEAIPPGTDVVFHLAAVVSAQAEADYDLGRRVNLRGTDAVVDACRRLVTAGGKPPRVVFTSSVASFSGGQDALLDDDARQVPANSYGAQKAAAELILADATRRGFLDAVSIRLPTVIVRPGRPNRAASSFLSAIVREPLLGLPADLPVPDAFAAWVCSPRRAVDWLLHAATMDTSAMGLDRGVNPPGISTTIAHLLQALDAIRPGASALVRHVEDKEIAAIVGLWPPAFEPMRAHMLGFASHEPVVEVVRAFVEDDLQATRMERGLPTPAG
ncbi:MAG TPA: NAD-dependent epimerase/dehydratase family protein [Acetobacteraceae bacterium]|nr:NAD-dependent epimerase/dehydratase family protein [Acetobacteraceae bacterium]